MFDVVHAMLTGIWEERRAKVADRADAIDARLQLIERKAEKLVGLIVEAVSRTLVSADASRLRKLHETREILIGRRANAQRSRPSFEATYRAAVEFPSKPWKIGASGDFDRQRTVIQLALAGPLPYRRNDRYPTADMALPFQVLAGLDGPGGVMVELDDETSNQLFKELAAWNVQLEALNGPAGPEP